MYFVYNEHNHFSSPGKFSTVCCGIPVDANISELMGVDIKLPESSCLLVKLKCVSELFFLFKVGISTKMKKP